MVKPYLIVENGCPQVNYAYIRTLCNARLPCQHETTWLNVHHDPPHRRKEGPMPLKEHLKHQELAVNKVVF